MHSQAATPLADDPQPRTDLRVVPTVGSRRLLHAFGVATAALEATGGYMHFCLYRHGYRTIPKIGIGFLLQVIGSAIIVLALLVGPHAVARVGRVTDGLAGVLTRVAAAGLAIGTLTAFALTRTPGGLFNFRERGLQPSPQALIALVAEVGVLLVLGAWLLACHLARRELEAAEATDLVDLSRWPERTRAIARREEPQPGAQLTFTDVTDETDTDIAYLEALQRGRKQPRN